MSVRTQILSGVISPLLLLALWSSLSLGDGIKIHQINRVSTKTLSHNSHIRQGGVMITTNTNMVINALNGKKKNSSGIMQGVIILDKSSSCTIAKNIKNIITP